MSGLPYDDVICEVCGNPSDDCVCPECPVCGEWGNESCYHDAPSPNGHNQIRTREQIETLAENKKRWDEDSERWAHEAARMAAEQGDE